ncbi:hypothetical protein HS041_11435 [Planomonospora sp. ID67723]|uniref:hypothetical protein n=1 Tax=Planomonospora sp. ID67723 TaxID=2738134 RepID=UPI0018C3C78E|nr:hypothetical protein [Planomonospora sp. ID67723]MBG0828378.1 hypothetical protein [Planomonospora sp. ID67723]
MLLLGVLWLFLAPLGLWLLVRGRGPARMGGILALAGLEAATLWLAPGAAPPAPPARPAAQPAPGVPGGPACSALPPVPERVKLTRRKNELRAVRLSWTAAADECGTAIVVLRHRNHRIKLWLHERAAGPPPAGSHTLPVTVADGTASAELRLVPPLPGRSELTAVDGRTGRPIALR